MCHITFELLASGRRSTFNETDVRANVLDAMAFYTGAFPEYFPHELGDPDFEPVVGEMTYDGYAPTPEMHPLGP